MNYRETQSGFVPTFLGISSTHSQSSLRPSSKWRCFDIESAKHVGAFDTGRLVVETTPEFRSLGGIFQSRRYREVRRSFEQQACNLYA